MSSQPPSSTDKLKGLLHHAGSSVMDFGVERALIAAPAVSWVLAGVTGGSIMTAIPYACATTCIISLSASESATNFAPFKNAIAQPQAEMLKKKAGWALGLVLPVAIGFGAAHDFNFNASRLLAPIVSDVKAIGSKFHGASISNISNNGVDGKKAILSLPPMRMR